MRGQAILENNMKKLCAEFVTEKKSCSMMVNDKDTKCKNFAIGSYEYTDAGGKKQMCNYATFAMKDKEDVQCNYLVSYDSSTGEVTVSKQGNKVLCAIQDNINLVGMLDKLSKAFFENKGTVISLDKMIEDVFDIRSDYQELPKEEECTDK